MINLSGKWKFREEFVAGMDEGYAIFTQEGNLINGELIFTEKIEDEMPFEVCCSLEGNLSDNSLVLDVVEFSVKSEEEIEYFPERREGIINANGQIVGSSEDEQGVCGFFVFERE